MGFFDSKSTVTNSSSTLSVANSGNTNISSGDSIRNIQIGFGDTGLAGLSQLDTPYNRGTTNAATAPLQTLAKGFTNPKIVIALAIVIAAFFFFRRR